MYILYSFLLYNIYINIIMKLVDIKDNISSKQRLVLCLSILILLMVVFSALKQFTSKENGIDYKTTSIETLINNSRETLDRNAYWNLNDIVYKFVNSYYSEVTKDVKNINYYYKALDSNYKKYLGKRKYKEQADKLISKVVGENPNVFSKIPEPLITNVYQLNEYSNAYICKLSTLKEDDNAYIGIVLDTEKNRYNIFYID